MLVTLVYSLYGLLTKVAKHCRWSDNIWYLNIYKQRVCMWKINSFSVKTFTSYEKHRLLARDIL